MTYVFSQNKTFQGTFFGWKDPEPTFKAPVENLRTYVEKNLLPDQNALFQVINQSFPSLQFIF